MCFIDRPLKRVGFTSVPRLFYGTLKRRLDWYYPPALPSPPTQVSIKASMRQRRPHKTTWPGFAVGRDLTIQRWSARLRTSYTTGASPQRSWGRRGFQMLAALAFRFFLIKFLSVGDKKNFKNCCLRPSGIFLSQPFHHRWWHLSDHWAGAAIFRAPEPIKHLK